MMAIEKKMIAYFAKLLASTLSVTARPFDAQYWSYFRKQAVQQQPDLAHDVVKVRLVTYQLGFAKLGFSVDKSLTMAQAALAYFIDLRSDFKVPETSKQLLMQLSQHFPLVAISNGNVDTKSIDIHQYFQHVYHAGWQTKGVLLRQKPAADMFTLACKQLTIKPEQLLHVGDCGRADILGALQAGCQAAWLSCYDVGKPVTVIPHIELTDITELQQLLID